MRNSTLTKLIATTAVAGLALTGCAPAGEAATHENGDEQQVTIGVFNGWPESMAPSELWKVILEEQGYNVTLEYADPAAVFTGLENGDYDFTTNVWLPQTHSSYMAEYGDSLVDLGVWNTEAAITVAVNEDAPIDSLDELAENADLFNNEIIGIEPGAGQTELMQELVIPTYGLDDMDFVTSSTPAMLTELQRATDNGENIVVTLWRPHWAYNAFPVKDLEDPEGTLGTDEAIHMYGTGDFMETHPTVAGWLGNFEMETELFNDLANELFNEYDGDEYGPVVDEWIANNQEYVDQLTQ